MTLNERMDRLEERVTALEIYLAGKDGAENEMNNTVLKHIKAMRRDMRAFSKTPSPKPSWPEIVQSALNPKKSLVIWIIGAVVAVALYQGWLIDLLSSIFQK